MRFALHNLKKNSILKLCILLFFVCFSHFALGYEFKAIYALAVFLLLLAVNANKFIYLTSIIFLAFIAAIYYPTAMLYGEPSFNIATAMLYTDRKESFEFLSNIPYFYYVVSFLILLLGYTATRLKFEISNKFRLSFVSIFAVIFLQAPIKTAISEHHFSLLNTGIPEVKFLKQSLAAISSTIEEHKRINEMLSKNDDYPKLISAGEYDTYVIVIGESVRKDLLHSYGFALENTPFLDKINGKIFTNYISAAPSTVPSLTHTISEHVKIQNNIITLAKKADFYTYWISNQGSISGADPPIASIGKRADTPTFIKKGSFTSIENDDELIPYINAAIKQKVKNKKLIVVHLMGSHTPACERTNNEYDQFYLSNRISCYVQSVKNTDRLLGTIYDSLKLSNERWSMMYLADHGVSFSNRDMPSKLDLIHGDEYKENYSVPFFITSYNDVNREFITARVSGMNFLSLYSEWLGINIYQKPNCQFISNQDCKFSTSVLNFKNNIVSFDKLPNDIIPIH